jgi:hypothetical protein
MTLIPCYLGEAVYNLRSGARIHFRPTGRLQRVGVQASAFEALHRKKGKQLSARILIGLNVGTKTVYTVKDVVEATMKMRPKGASFLAQRGVYFDAKGRRIDEPSVQIIILDFDKMTKQAFVDDMASLAEKLRKKFKQDEVVLEIQKSGVVTDVYGVTA